MSVSRLSPARLGTCVRAGVVSCRMGGGISMRSLADRFWEKVDKSGDCWIWTAATDKDGYGVTRLSPPTHRSVRATHAVWLLATGELPPPGMFVCHRCDNPPCVRPDHLFIGTVHDNVADMRAKGRSGINPRSAWTHCSHGHEFTTENTIWRGTIRQCRACHDESRSTPFGSNPSRPPLKTVCVRGHALLETRGRNGRCRECHAARQRAYNARKRQIESDRMMKEQ